MKGVQDEKRVEEAASPVSQLEGSVEFDQCTRPSVRKKKRK